MRVMKWSMIALAVAAGTSQLAIASSQDESKGFVEDSQLGVKLRNLYFSRDFRNNDDGQSRAAEWGQGFIGTFESGFTQGTVGVGVDAIGLLGLKLDSGRGRAGTGLFPTGSDGRSQDDYSEAHGAVKLRISDTTLKYGGQFTALPVFATDDSRLLPEVAEGFLLTSKEIKGLELNAGHFTRLNAQAQSYKDSIGGKSNGVKGPGLTEANIFGGTYTITDGLSTSLYYSRVEDHFRKWYGNVNWALPISDNQGLVFDFNIYDTKSIGDNRTGAFVTKADGTDELDNIAASLSAAYNIGAHTFTLAYQKVTGDGDYAYGIDGGGTVFLANSIARSDFNAEDEKSWQARYDLNFAEFGVPGLTFMTRYVHGSGATTQTTSNGKEWERDIDIKYVLQEGPAKDLSFRVRQATYRSSDGVYYGSNSIDELRLIVEYPLSIL
ncbi:MULTISPECIES: OprD family porin [Pseudomonas]|uniref:Imipenem/basic amino acid-specific outer membrane pore n=1 Tax=Pseudomonas hunanensis TaxID=1247546 RepID=A0ACC6K9M5_9PSED|nr:MULTISPECIES: OprD family porin [Pseudomonas]MBP2260925.1 imipenem/basic amino acid-specific outer membrane pore [Pseudomonas sp. BP8]MDR6715111.1 imipenem/basic amino acid-specific outer membrane pore [Pseudomonas hunanensis]HDS1736638.1 OprD family porin [Pseudomonas putida]